MALPDGFLDELRARVSLSQVVGKKVLWDKRKSQQGKGDWWAPCPFHQEKTASFHVDDRKGFYYCFGCQAKGNAFTFVQETENVGFMEAVEILAREAGMEVPKGDPKAQARADRNTRLREAVDAAARFYRTQLSTAAAAEARAYLQRRGVKAETLERFGIGYAPTGRTALADALTGRGMEADLLVEAGLCRRSERDGSLYDFLRDRIVFPIRDGQDRAVAFGGRAMSADAQAKYLNTSETPIFDKGAGLYNIAPARSAAGRSGSLIVAEGYMDVIALHEHGFPAAVAPLGTAITEAQLALIWRISSEPVVALDGDTAGLRAAYRLISRALPMLEPGRELRFVLLPEGKDPDDLLRSEGGPEAMGELIGKAQPMAKLLWREKTEGLVLDSPERRASLDRDLRAVLDEIRDRSIKMHYAEEFRRLRADLYGYGHPGGPDGSGSGASPEPRGLPPASGFQKRGGAWKKGTAPLLPSTEQSRASLLASGAEGVTDRLREAVILATLIHTPVLIDEFAHILEEFEFRGQGHAAIAASLLRVPPGVDSEGVLIHLREEVGARGLETMLSPRHVQIAPSVRRAGDAELARACLTEELAKLGAARGMAREMAESVAAISGSAGEGLDWRIAQAADAVLRAASAGEGGRSELETAPNGARLDRREKDALQELLRRIGYEGTGP
ncbi:DNA primase [Tropicimonas sp. IMCC34011]|uniref:DNA primase n=1 Tax=Tropicimonas sp. IMCC34011 TaxID=2248759 RepID=UPI000E23CE57|nr:DNA primase [Tropicimonas sp. IMCC34011]